MMAITTSSSISVKPRRPGRLAVMDAPPGDWSHELLAGYDPGRSTLMVCLGPRFTSTMIGVSPATV